jgi:BioD-like phosphotransacetylase family protein
MGIRLLSRYLSGATASVPELTALLRNVAGINVVTPEDRPEISVSVAVMVDKAIGTASKSKLKGKRDVH